MRTADLQETQAGLPAVVDDATRGEPTIITRQGLPAAVVLGFAEWEKLTKRRSFADLLLASPIEPGDIPERDRTPIRDFGL